MGKSGRKHDRRDGRTVAGNCRSWHCRGWIVLTNGQVWQVWHLTAGLPVALDIALEVDVLGDDSPAQKTDVLFYLSKEAFKRHLVDDLWRVKAATSANSLRACTRRELGSWRLFPAPRTIGLGIGQIMADKAAEQPTSGTRSSRD